MSTLPGPTRSAGLARIAELDRARRYSDAEVSVAKKAKLSDDELIPLMRARLDAWKAWGDALGKAEPGGHNARLSDRRSDSEYQDRKRARKIAAVPDDVYTARRNREDPDELTLTAVLRDGKEATREDKRDQNPRARRRCSPARRHRRDIPDDHARSALGLTGRRRPRRPIGRATPTYATHAGRRTLHATRSLLRNGDREGWVASRLGGNEDTLRIIERDHDASHGAPTDQPPGPAPFDTDLFAEEWPR